MTDKQTTHEHVSKTSRPAKGLKRLVAVAILILVFAGICAGAAALWMTSFISTPMTPGASPMVFNVSQGQGMGSIARHLKERNLISSALGFKLYARYRKVATRIKTGEYELSAAQSPAAILDDLVQGRVKLYRFTVPEGLNMMQIAQKAEDEGFCSAQQFLALCTDHAFIRRQNISAATLEGYLFPDTYLFPRGTTCKKLIGHMTRAFLRTFSDAWKKRTQELGFSIHEIVTLASMIEKETGDAGERPLIASVFHNRLKKNMRLESDPTVIYGVDDYDGRIRYRHLRRITPYNTYKIKGLPAGPIANPGAKAIEAALYPARTQYLFFVSRNDTTHEFSTNLKDHNRAVKKYQLDQ